MTYYLFNIVTKITVYSKVLELVGIPSRTKNIVRMFGIQNALE